MTSRRLVETLALVVSVITLAGAAPDGGGQGAIFRTDSDPEPANTEPEGGVARTGSFQLTFTERSPLSDLKVIVRRMGWVTEQIESYKAPLSYNIGQETFEAYVPESYTGKEPYGLLVWINPGPNGRVPERYLDVLDEHKLIAVGANNSGNHREVWSRMGLAIDAAHNMKARYRIDARRVYVGGVSGGGRTSSHLGIGFPDVFRGGYYLIGVNYYRTLPSEKDPTGVWRQRFMKPTKELLRLAKERSRHVLLTGDTDGNREQTHVYYGAMTEEKYKYVTYFQVPGMGHSAPDAEWFEKGIVELDKPLAEIPAELDQWEYKDRPAAAATKPAVVAKATTPAPAKTPTAAPPPAPARPAKPDDKQGQADRELRTAKLYVEDPRLRTKARERLKTIVDTYPGTPAAKEAEEWLRKLG